MAKNLNDDCWTLILSKLTALGEILRCAGLSKNFNQIVENHPCWAVTSRRLGLAAPKPRARKYKTWKSMVLRLRGKFCELCMKKSVKCRSLHETNISTYLCPRCYGPAEAVARTQRTAAKLSALKRELSGHHFLDQNSVEDLMENLPSDAKVWVASRSMGEDAGRIAQKIVGRLERRSVAVTRLGRGCVETEAAIKLWVETGSGSFDAIAQIIETRKERGDILREMLGAHDLTLRSDSALCQDFIMNAKGNAEDIASTMREMDWFFRHTRYETLRYVWDSDDSEDDYGFDSDYGFGYDRQPRRYVDSEHGKRQALAKWVDTLINKHKWELLSAESFTECLEPHEIPPPSLHARIVEAIKEKARESISTILSESVPFIASEGGSLQDLPKDHTIPPLWRNSITPALWQQAKGLYLHGYDLVSFVFPVTRS
jgi:F-box associated protein